MIIFKINHEFNQAKSAGDVSRQLISFVDNETSSNETNDNNSRNMTSSQSTAHDVICFDHVARTSTTITTKEVAVSINDGLKLINIKDKQFNQIRHDREGLILMNINESITRFTITLGPAEEFNEECTVIGEIVDSMEILKNINDCFAGADVQADGGITLTNVTIYSCGEQ
ncbi:unnamed protein product [Adineta steineri]|uniref:PPIase cyclophilin-type domain-containing protein n=1 Tax=Adineta steineri TaxID=433720 RepID=A0A818SFX9_9BILA|nr:unnamed protein product [Adineta steineri]CAF3665506.1 unnamed protein product [Adineta steineri]